MTTPPLQACDATPLAELATVEYLGNKRRLLDGLVTAIVERVGSHDEVLDVFTGTGAVAAGLKSAGFRVVANDHLAFCAHFARALLELDGAPTFAGLGETSYQEVLAHLNQLDGEAGFVYRNYSPASVEQGDPERRYFTRRNAGRIDAVRRQIEDWRPHLSPAEYSLLLSDLLRAVSAVSNVAGTYGCYLKHWKPRALEVLRIDPQAFILGRTEGHSIRNDDALELLRKRSVPIVYADPPYTKRQYAAYYHVLETITLDDSPKIEGSTGLRDWRPQASDFCYRRRAPGALRELVEAADCTHFFLSYNEDGQIPHQSILKILGDFGPVEVIEWRLPRYRSSALSHRGASVTERLYCLRKGI